MGRRHLLACGLLLLLAIPAFAADVKIGALPAASSAATTDEYAANQSGTTRKITLAQMKTTLFGDDVALAGVLSPSQLTGDQNDWNPTNLATASIIRVDSDRLVTITGLSGGASGRLLWLSNVGNFPVVLAIENAGSSASNRFTGTAGPMLWPNSSLQLWYDGTSSRWRVLPAKITYDDEVYEVVDEFTGAGSAAGEAGEIGELGMAISASGTCTHAFTAATAGHPGVYAPSTGSTSGNNCRLHPRTAATDTVIIANQVRYFGVILNVPTITTAIVRAGIGTDLTSSTFGNHSAFVEYNAASDASWRFTTRDGATTQGPTDSTVDVVAGNWYLLEIVASGTGTWDLYINRVRRASHATNVPGATAVTFGVMVQTSTTAARSFQIDFLRVRSINLGQRWS